MKTLRKLLAPLSKIVWSGVLILGLLAASITLCLFGHVDYAIMCVLWAVLGTQIRIANKR